MLSNAYFLAKFRFDTAENEPAKNLQKIAKFANFADPNPLTLTLQVEPTTRTTFQSGSARTCVGLFALLRGRAAMQRVPWG